MRALLDAGMVTATGTALAAVLTAVARVVKALRAERHCEHCWCEDAADELVD